MNLDLDLNHTPLILWSYMDGGTGIQVCPGNLRAVSNFANLDFCLGSGVHMITSRAAWYHLDYFQGTLVSFGLLPGHPGIIWAPMLTSWAPWYHLGINDYFQGILASFRLLPGHPGII